jgi:hypothetical protein
VTAADVDGDGDQDVLFAGRDSGEVGFFRQERTHVVVLDPPGSTYGLGPDDLEAVDANGGRASVTVTVAEAPTAGSILLDGSPVGVGGSFMQADIDDGLVTYAHDDPDPGLDTTILVLGDGSTSFGATTVEIYVSDLARGLYAHWPLDETSGTVAPDVTGSNPGVLVDGPEWQPDGGRIDGALSFDGIDDRVAIEAFDVPSTSGLTLAAWVRPDDLGGSPRILSKATGTAEQDHDWMMSLHPPSTLRFRLKAGGTTSTLVAPDDLLSTGTWSHTACTYDGTAMRIYVDGILVATAAKSGTLDQTPTTAVALGNQPTGAGEESLSGRLDDVRLYDRAVDPAEVLSMFRGTTTGSTSTTAPAGVGASARLEQNTPNPFNPVTVIPFVLPEGGAVVSLRIHDVRGRVVRTLLGDVYRREGRHTVRWDGRDDQGRTVASGTYLARLTSSGRTWSTKMVMTQ